MLKAFRSKHVFEKGLPTLYTRNYKILHTQPSFFNKEVVVSQKGSWRKLSFGDAPSYGGTLLQGHLKIKDEALVHSSRCDYINTMICSALSFMASKYGVEKFLDDREFLFIGLGIGCSPTFFANLNHPSLSLDVIEIDPIVIDVAEKYFEFPRNKMRNVYAQDLAEYLKRDDKSSYDVVFLDIYTQYGLPTHLFGEDTLSHIANVVKSTGILIANVHCPEVERYVEICENFAKIFDNIRTVACEVDYTNNIMVCSNTLFDPQDVTEAAQRLDEEYKFDVGVKHVMFGLEL
ncbi:polyamine aminopropyl transferase [Acrasis kona]|uniref:Polyamine aminopropyl transferase n=1 Tax=Acrasis kona TaxID=1008807 RepID=A0AAW2Z2E1_9EUKA